MRPIQDPQVSLRQGRPGNEVGACRYSALDASELKCYAVARIARRAGGDDEDLPDEEEEEELTEEQKVARRRKKQEEKAALKSLLSPSPSACCWPAKLCYL